MQNRLKIVVLLFISLFLYSFIGAASAANTYNINDSSYNNYFNGTGYINNPSIQPGDVLDLSGNINNKNMYIDRPLNITSSDKTAQIFNGTITILTGGSGTNITNLKINNSNVNGTGIFLNGTQNNTVKGNQIHCNGPYGFGIALVKSDHNNILGNTVITTQRSDLPARTHSAVVLGESNYNIIGDNTVKSDGADCIYLSSLGSGNFVSNGPSNYNKIINNICVGVDTSWCYAIQMVGSYNTAQKNTIKSENFPEKASSYNIGTFRGISSEPYNMGDAGNTIIDNTITATNCGIFASSNCTISGNTITDYVDTYTKIGSNKNGIYAGTNCTITKNTITMNNGGYGIELDGSNNTITENKITTKGTQESIYLFGKVSGNNLYNNTISSKSTGIKLKKLSSSQLPTQNTLTKNHITTSSTYAIDSSEGKTTTITNNYLISNNSKKQGDETINKGTSDTINGNTPNKTAPKVIATYPTNKKTGFSRTITITIKYNENIYKSTNYTKITVKDLTTGKKCTITATITSNKINIKNKYKRSAYHWYQITIPAGAVKDKAGNKTTKTTTIKFKTGK